MLSKIKNPRMPEDRDGGYHMRISHRGQKALKKSIIHQKNTFIKQKPAFMEYF